MASHFLFLKIQLYRIWNILNFMKSVSIRIKWLCPYKIQSAKYKVRLDDSGKLQAKKHVIDKKEYSDYWKIKKVILFFKHSKLLSQRLVPLMECLNSLCFQIKCKKYFSNSTGASDRSVYLIFNKRFETLLTICRPKNVLSAGSLCESLVPSTQSKCPKRTFLLPPKVSCVSFKYVIKATEMFHWKRKLT